MAVDMKIQLKKERPILYSAPMVRAKLAGLKTQTRREYKLPAWVEWDYANGGEQSGSVIPKDPKLRGWYSIDELPCPFGKVGERLWGRETWAYHPDFPKSACRAVYRADPDKHDVRKWHPSIFMPRWASRLLDEIIEVRIERLQDITEEDAIAEGVEQNWIGDIAKGPIESYQSLWEWINGKGSWDKNPWVWVIKTKPIQA